MHGANIRPAKLEDLPGILTLYRHLHPSDRVIDPADVETAWTAVLSSGLTTTFVVDVAGQLASSCSLAVIPNLSRQARPYGIIENVMTLPEYRRRGLGRLVLQAAIDLAFEADCYKVMLATGSRQETTLRFYEGAGFRMTGKTHFEIRR